MKRIIFLAFALAFYNARATTAINEDSLYEAILAKKNDTAIVNQEIAIAKNLENSKPKKSLMFSRQALKVSESIKYSMGIAASLNALGRGYKVLGDFDSSLYYFRKSLEISTDQENQHWIATNLMHIGTVLKGKGIYDSAAIYYHSALQIAEETNDVEIRANCLNNLGNVLKYQENIDEAISCYMQALTIYQEEKNEKGIANAFLNLGICYDLEEKYPVSEKYFRDALAIFSKTNDRAGIAKCDNNIAESLQYQKKTEEAITYLHEALEIQREMGDKNGMASTLYSLVQFNKDIGNIEKALEFSTESLPLAEEVGNLELLLNNYLLAHELYHESGNIPKADESLEKAVELKDSLYNESKTRIINELQTKYDTEKSKQEIKLLNEENRAKDLRQNLFLILIIALSGILVALSYIYYQRQRIAKQGSLIQKQKIEDLIRQHELGVYNSLMTGQERERKRIAGDLHDRLGSLLATVKAYFSALKPSLDPLHNRELDLYGKASSLIDQTVAEVYQISNDLNSSVVNFGLERAVRDLCETITQGSDITCKVLAYNLDDPIDHDTEIGIYRVVQELLSNILKHAHAKTVTIQLNRVDGMLQVTVEDDGVGFNFQEKINSGRMGLKNMMARVEKLNGTFYVDSVAGRGSFTILKVPCSEIEQSLLN